jgi:predicted CXXCH cytochrome family protein
VAAVVLLGLAALMVAQWSGLKRSRQAERHVDKVSAKLPHLESVKNYASSHTCQACHPGEHASWHRSYHRTMTQIAVPGNVVGAFDGTTVVSDGLDYRVTRDGDDFWAEMPDPDVMMYVVQGGKKLAWDKIPRVRQPVVMTTGSHHYQTYWVTSPRYDRLMQTLPLVYLIGDRRWIPREAAFMRPPGDTGRFITQWNHHCIRCHSTAGNPGLDPKTGMLDSKVAELGISCEACHGPGEAHVLKHQNPLTRYAQHFSGKPDPTIVNPAKLDHRRSSQVCGQCHGVYVMRDEFAMKSAYEGPLFTPGEDLDHTRYYIQHPANDPSPARREELQKNPSFFNERWWDDGTILAGGREYSALSVSGCFTRGKISCLSCHSMHDSDPVDQLKPHMDGSASCVQCHTAPKYNRDVAQHTFHKAESSGSDCLNCHMPHTTYALLGAIRSHQIDSPRIAGSARYGVPNACNLCHLDKTLAWTQDLLFKRYGQRRENLSDEQRTISAALLWLLKGNAAQRAITSWHFGWSSAQAASGAGWLAPFQARLLADPYGVVRYVAERGLTALPGFKGFRYDFLAAEPELRREVERVVAQWKSSGNTKQRTGEEILIQSDGTLMEAKIQALLSQRDNRPVTIKE